jgi:hypothetical protein
MSRISTEISADQIQKDSGVSHKVGNEHSFQQIVILSVEGGATIKILLFVLELFLAKFLSLFLRYCFGITQCTFIIFHATY